MPLVAVTHDAMLLHDPGPGHVERPTRLDAARRGVLRCGADVRWEEAPLAADEDLLRVHAPEHLARLRAACARTGGAWLDPDTHVAPPSLEAALRAAGASVRAADLAAAGTPAFALVRPPGHHATPGRAMGFCLLNNVAVAAAALAARGRRVAVVDVDVHHGNGTQEAFDRRDDVLFASLHQHPLYPGTGMLAERGAGAGEGATLNLPLPAGTGHDGWLEVLEAAVLPALRAFRPNVALVSAGFDAHRADPLGGMLLVAESFHEAVRRVRAEVPRVAAVLEGGYDLAAVESSAASVAAALAGAPPPVVEGAPPGLRPWATIRDDVRAVHAARWGIG